MGKASGAQPEMCMQGERKWGEPAACRVKGEDILLAYVKTRKVGDMLAGYSLGCSGYEMELRVLSGRNKTKSRIATLDSK